MPARSILWPDPRVKPPFGSVEIDRAHLLAQEIIGAYLINEGAGGVSDLAQRDGAMTLGGGGVWTVGPLGLSFAGLTPEGFAQVTSTAFAGPTTVITRIRRRAVSAVNTLFARHTTDGVGSDYWARFSTDNKIYVDIPWVVGGVVVSASAYASTSTPYTVAMTRSGSTGSWTWKLYVNGVNDGTTSANGNNPSTGTQTLTIQNRATGGVTNVFGDMETEYFYRFARAFSADELARIGAEPYAFLRPILRRRYFVPAGAGASMKAAIWARNANTLLGSGRVA